MSQFVDKLPRWINPKVYNKIEDTLKDRAKYDVLIVEDRARSGRDLTGSAANTRKLLQDLRNTGRLPTKIIVLTHLPDISPGIRVSFHRAAGQEVIPVYQSDTWRRPRTFHRLLG